MHGRRDGDRGVSRALRLAPEMAQEPEVTSLMSKDLLENPRKEIPMITVPGQTFYDGPDDLHVVDRNASSTKPARFPVVLIKDKDAPALVPAE